MADAGLLGRVAGKIAGAASSLTSGWMGPGDPPRVVAPAGTEPRRFDFPVGVNLRHQPRVGERFSAMQLRALAGNCTLVRMAIETRKQQVARLGWSIQPEDRDATLDAEGEAIQQHMRKPDLRRRWRPWLKALMDDLLVLDAGAIGVRRNRGGGVYALQVFDGGTIVPKVDATGDIPVDPEAIAYQQVVKGVPIADFTRRDLVYAQLCPRTHALYGFSPVEQIAIIVQLCIRRELSQLEYFTEGTVPEAIVTMPKDWNSTQIREFQTWWDTLFIQNQGQQRKMRFVPGGDGMNIHWAKDALLKDETDEWLARVVCYAFSLPPTWAVRQMNRATAEAVQDAALEEGQLPFLSDLADVFDDVLEYGFGRPDLRHVWDEPKKSDPYKEAQVHEIYLRSGAETIDEVRERIGRPALGFDRPIVITPMGPVPLLPGDGGDDGDTTDDADTTLPDGTTPTSDVQSTALNGAQIASLLEIVDAVGAGKITTDGAVAVIQVSFPGIDETEARRIVAGAQAVEPPPPPPPPPGLPPPPGAPADGADGEDPEDEGDDAAEDGEDGAAEDDTDEAAAAKAAQAWEGRAERGDPQLRKRRPAPSSPPSPSRTPSSSASVGTASRAPWGAY